MNTVSTPRRRPAPGQTGSTPFSSSKFQSSLVPMNRPTPSRSYHPPKNKSKPTTGGFSSNSRDIFRTSTPQANRTSTFSPDIPLAATKMTPSARKFVPQKSVGAGMSSTTSTDLFKMRIPSPDPELTGEEISKQVPDDPNRPGTIYADQYLAHKCPAHFDEQQRRQFFCILDLRRLKYAANEIFMKKDWKLNILNFAKEYEKSRGLILLRYGLYEFKKVKPSAELLKRWRAANGLPDPVPEAENATNGDTNATSRTPETPGTATKRKAADDLASKENALGASTPSQNKRRNVDREEQADRVFSAPAPFKKSKRKADETDELEENQPSKMQKQPSSAAKSKFESILDRAQTATGSPTKRPLTTPAQSTPFGSQNAFSSQTTDSASKANPFATTSSSDKPASTSLFSKQTNGTDTKESVLAAHKPGSALPTTTGMFGYLSGSSANTSGNEKDDAEDEDEEDASTESGSEEGSESQDVVPSIEPSVAVTSEVSTPPVQNGSFSSKFGGASASFGDLSNSSASVSTKGGLFGRVKLGVDGQPLRANPSEDEKETSSLPEVATPAAEVSKATPKTPGDFRFDPATNPIQFSPSVAATSAKPALPSASTVPETPKATPKVEETPAPKVSSIFGISNQATTTPAAPPPSKPLFGQSNNASSIFQPKPAAASSLFGAQKSTDTPSQPSAPSTESSAASLFGSKPETKPASVPEQPKSLFGASTTSTPAPFGKALEPTNADSKDEPKPLFSTPSTNAAPSLFGQQSDSKPAGTQDPPKGLFGATTPGDTPVQKNKRGLDDSQKLNEPGAKKAMNLFGANSATNSPATSTGFKFGATSAQAPASSIFNNFKTDTSNATNGTNGATSGANGIFSAPARSSTPDIFKPQPAASTSFFGNSATENKTPSFSFGASQPAPAEQTQTGSGNSGSIFGNTVATSGPSFDFRASSPAASPAPTFGNNQSTSSPSFEFKASSPAPSFGSNTGAGGPSFEFKASSPAPSPAPTPSFGNNAGAGAPSFEFKASSPGPSTAPASTPTTGRRIATPRRRLGTPGATPNTSFNAPTASQPQQGTGFSFGSNTNASGTESAMSSFGGANSSSGFNFQFGGNGQSASNPFAPSNSQVTAPSSFGTSFDQPKPSTPTGQNTGVFSGFSNGTGAAPSFNFQSATPQQNTPSIFAPKPTGFFGNNNNLQPNGDSPMGASE